ncbi:hypothetical protein GCM10014719_38450 [Planomonospora parontospora subsp. antibiotica]|nr:hypothetical protein GCM10014719_38450 [Planomonospora parontospora subsp. antibiotica]GII17162.1 hypothetical protein Ppa05_38880 [Planomonospora parontospora subsp. antibiotica]
MYHFTHVDNLPGITTKGLLADGRNPHVSVECAEPGIKERRRSNRVPIGPGGVVADYVPFYFAPRSPMLYRIHKGGVSGYQRSQDELIYLVTRLSRIQAYNLSWVASDLNAALATATFTDQASELETHLDHEVLEAKLWANTPEDGSRMQRRMAELLVYEHVPWGAFSHVAVRSDSSTRRVSDLLKNDPLHPKPIIRANWYF